MTEHPERADRQTILLARHGQTEWNVIGRRQGQMDSPLTDEGRIQAEQVAALVQGVDLQAIYTSPLTRASDTAAIIANQHPNLPVVTIDELAELHHGDFAGLTNKQINEQFPGALEHRSKEKYSWRFPNGESYADLDIRSAQALRAIRHHGHESLLIVSHAMISRMLLRNLLALDPDEALTFNMPHGNVLEVEPGAANRTRWLSGNGPPVAPSQGLNSANDD